MPWELLCGLPDAEREVVLAAMRVRRFGRGDAVFLEGQRGDSLYFISAGHAAVRATTPAGAAVMLSILGPGQAFGELALLKRSSTRTASVEALEQLNTRVLHRDAFIALCGAHPAVERLLSTLLAARVDRLSRHLVEALHLTVEQRLVRRLVETARTYGNTGVVVLPLTQEDVAQLAGTTRPTANAVLNDLRDTGLIEFSRGKIRILDPGGLARRAG
ncbi:MAG: Crp/Fnr family transcriptional regulator [Actinomycetota bacterium]|nr:Crp/Fnr family transcriptional regulator [Actinomycetota bacterium]